MIQEIPPTGHDSHSELKANNHTFIAAWSPFQQDDVG